MKVLVIYQMIPDETRVAVVDMEAADYDYFKKAHNVYINSVDGNDEDAENVVLELEACFRNIYAAPTDNSTEIGRRHCNTWENTPQPTSDLSGVDKLIMCGFYL